MRIAVASDHAGFEEPVHIKPAVIKYLREKGHEVVDCGTDGPDPVDYPDYAKKLVDVILKGDADCGVLICGSGNGVCMAANRFPGIRAAVCVTEDMTRRTREHNDANVCCVGTRTLDLDDIVRIIDVFISTEFSGHYRHRRRISKMD